MCCRFVDKLPEWIDRFRAEGLTDTEIQEVIRGKAQKYIDKWGNSSRVGILINSYNNEQRQKASLQSSPKQAGVHSRQPSGAESPPSRTRLSSLPALEQRGSVASVRRNRSTVGARGKTTAAVRASEGNPHTFATLENEHFRTTN